MKTKFLVNIINNNSLEIENMINNNKQKKEIINKLNEYMEKSKFFDLFEIDPEKFYYFCLFYNNLKSSGIKFCFLFISDIVKDKLENKIEEKIKLYIYDNKDISQDINNEESEKKQENDFISKIAKTFKKKIKLSQNY